MHSIANRNGPIQQSILLLVKHTKGNVELKTKEEEFWDGTLGRGLKE